MKVFVMAAPVVFLSACSALPGIDAELSPANADAMVPATRYVSVLAGTADYRPVAPRPWLESNEQVAPKGRRK